jgi:hypothetical protein
MSTYRRDALLAALTLGTLLGVLAVGRSIHTLTGPIPAAAGVAGALLVEGAFLRSGVVAALWERPIVQFGSTLGVLAGGVTLAVVTGPTVVATLCWGLATYFVLLAAMVVLGENPLAVGT